ncbi:hexose transporter protein [Aspergillus karnatakaensis]|uniref:hexose transporter protein n=1 Tax=Aspergillus karnatakaensis TaxID=1810916 RepID=UPI003CCCCB23
MAKDEAIPTHARFSSMSKTILSAISANVNSVLPSDNTNSTWWKDPCLRWNVFYNMGSMLCPFYLGYDQGLLTGLQAMPTWNEYFDSPSGHWLGIISAAILLPGIVMGFPAAWICNTWGRKVCVMIGSVLVIAGAIWNALSPNTVHFIVSRVIMGIGGALAKTSAPVLLQETAHPRLRSNMSTMYYGCYYIGSLLSSIMCVIGLEVPNTWSWRFPCLLALVGPAAVLLILINAPESPRFLMRNGQTAKALHVLAKYHANGDPDDALVQWEYREIQTALEEETMHSKASYTDFLKTPGNRKRLLVTVVMAMGVNWVGNGIVSYYLSPVLKSVGISEPINILSVNAGLAAWNLVIAETAGLYVDDWGRRPTLLTSTIGMIFSYAFVMGFSAGFAESGGTKTNLGIAAVPFLFIFFGFYDIGWTTLNYSYIAEIMPYTLRAKGLAIYLCVQQVGNTFNQFVNPIALDAIAWRYYAVYIAIDCGFVLMIYYFFPETKKLSIEEVGMIFDLGATDARAAREMAAVAFEESDREKGEMSAVHVEAPEKKEG